MNGKIVSIHLTVIVPKAPYVVIDAPNVYHDNICIKHRRRQCPDCMKDQETCEKHGRHRCKECRREMKKKGLVKWTKGGGVVANTEYGNNWERTLDIKRLLKVELKISSKGYKPLFYVEFSTIDYMYENKEKYEGMHQKLKILEGLDSRGRLVKFEKHKPPGVKKSDDPNYDDDLWIIQSAIVLEKHERVDCYIMSNDHFSIYSKEGSKRFIQFDWTWEKIHDRRIAYDWMPPDSDEDGNQQFTSPKWENIPKFELSIEEEYKLISAEIRDTEIELEKLKEKKSNLSPIIKEQDDIPKILKTEEKEHRKIDQFKKEVTTAVWWACEKKMGSGVFSLQYSIFSLS